MQLRRLLPILLLTLVACGGTPEPAAEDDPRGVQPAQDAALEFDGVWALTDDKLGSMTLTVTDGDWVLTDVRGKRWEFDDGPDTEDGVTTVLTELETPKPGFKMLFNRPHTSLEAAGTYNFRKGSALARFQPMNRDGLEVMWCKFYRESDPRDTTRAVNLIRQPPPPSDE